MKASTTILALLALGSAGQAVLIDSSLPDGIYVADAGATEPGKHIIRRLEHPVPATSGISRRSPSSNRSDLSTRIRSSRHRILREALPIAKGRSFCRRGRKYNTTDFLDAINLLFESPLFWVPARNTRFALSGGVVVYVCALSQWNSASLLEFMSAMDHLDAECGPNTAAKLSLGNWSKFYGRETRENEICQAESTGRGIENELVEVVAAGCRQYVSGINRWLGHRGQCNDNAYGKPVWQMLKTTFPWYKTPADSLETQVEDGGTENKTITIR